MEKQSIIPYIAVLVFGIIVGAGSMYRYITTNYYEVHTSNIGGFVFKSGKAYSLEELKDF